MNLESWIIDIILTEEDNVNYPITCCFNGNYRKLYVVNNYSNVISVFNVVWYVVIKNGNQINLKENKNNNQGLLKLTSYFDSLDSLTFYYLLFFRCQLYVFYFCVDKCLSSTVDDDWKTIIFNVLLNSKKITGARGTDHPPFSNFLFTNLSSIKFLYFFIISSLFPYFNFFVSIFIQSYVNIKLQVSTLYRY